MRIPTFPKIMTFVSYNTNTFASYKNTTILIHMKRLWIATFFRNHFHTKWYSNIFLTNTTKFSTLEFQNKFTNVIRFERQQIILIWNGNHVCQEISYGKGIGFLTGEWVTFLKLFFLCENYINIVETIRVKFSMKVEIEKFSSLEMNFSAGRCRFVKKKY